jgi:hypothetical protein
MTVQRAQLDLYRWQGRGRLARLVVVWKGGCVPIQAHGSQATADGPQVPDVHGGAIIRDYHQARRVGAG